MSIQSQAIKHLERAETWLRDGEVSLLRATALEARVCVECIAYEILLSHRETMDNSAVKKWQPSKIVNEVAAICPSAMQEAVIEIGPKDGSSEAICLNVFSMTSKEISKWWHKLGSYIHPIGLDESGNQIRFKDNADIHEVLTQLLPLLRKHLINPTRNLVLRTDLTNISCSCGFEFKRDTQGTSHDQPQITQCPNCRKEYALTPGEVAERTVGITCPFSDCKSTIELNSVVASREGKHRCPNCGKGFAIKHDVYMVGGESILDVGCMIVTQCVDGDTK